VQKILEKNREKLEYDDKLEDFREALEGECNMKIYLNQ
jgi:hypothetical protein